jgi:hypothetical protein
MTAPEIPLFTYEEWLEFGKKAGFCTDLCCITHRPYNGMHKGVHKGDCEIVVHILVTDS